MPAADPIALFLRGHAPCHRHPSRRAPGFCDVCKRRLCRACLLPEHRCTGPATTLVEGAPRRQRAAILGLGLLLAGAAVSGAIKGVADRHPPPPRLQAPAKAAVALPAVRSRPAGVPQRVATTAADDDTAPRAAASRPVEVATPGRRFDAPATSFDRGSPHRRRIVLTFDAGASAAGATDLLDILAQRSVPATIFVTGEFLRSYPQLARRLVADGHEIGNHTDTHLHLTVWESRRRHDTHPHVDRERLLAELQRTATAFRQITGTDMSPLWRAPYGEHNAEIRGWAAAAGWRHVGWTPHLDTLDWVTDPASSIFRSAEEIAVQLLRYPDRDPRGAAGGIVLMHLSSERPRQERLSEVLPEVLEGYRRRGFEFVTASDMIRASRQ